MDSGNGAVKYRPGFTILYVNAKVPAELKYLINYYKSVAGLPSFNWAVRQLLETHPALAKLAAELYHDSKTPDGPGVPVEGDTPDDRGPSALARLFLGLLRRSEIPYSRWLYAFRAPPRRAGTSGGYGGIKKWLFQPYKLRSPH